MRVRFPPPELRRAVALSLGVAFPLLSTALSLAMRPLVSSAPLALYVPAVVFATYLGGLGPGLLSLGLSAGLCGWFFIAPYDAFGPSQAEVVVVSLFLVIGGVLCWIAAALRDGYLERDAHAHRFESLVATSSDVIWTTTPEGLAHADSPS
ncbi:DUF4118 domain-containing protein [Anaeromyxobacter soli]|nr:DUF4118 domain-containing protein [Anaeromyxobacter sp. SG29]